MMFIIGIYRIKDDYGNVLYNGSIEECYECIEQLKHVDYYRIAICKEDGTTDKVIKKGADVVLFQPDILQG